MLEKLILLVITGFLTQSVLAETCPSIREIKQQLLHGWQAFDNESRTPLSPKRLAEFKLKAQKFLLAEWVKSANKGAHCYYSDRAGSHLDVFLAKKNLTPNNTQEYWYRVSGYLHCAAGETKCKFTQERTLRF